MSNESEIEEIDKILANWKSVIGADFEGYRNHVVRMASFCFALRACNEEEKQKIVIAACFHDIGLWTARTLDYIPPSVPPALQYLAENGLDKWSKDIELMITEHHKLRPYSKDNRSLIELFRQGDLVDFSLGLVKFDLPNELIQKIKDQFPNAGFHTNLVKLSVRWFVKHPLNPVPMLKW